MVIALRKIIRSVFFRLVMFPSHSPVLIRASRLNDEIFAREFEGSRQVFSDESPHQSAFHVESEALASIG